MRPSATIAAVLTVLLIAGSARADDDEDARAAMRRGVAAFGRGEAEKALEEYETAKRLVPHANAPYLYAAEALVALARYREAVDNLERYLAKSPDVSDADDVRRRIARIKAEHYPGRVQIVSNMPDATVELDGELRGKVREVELSPGRHHFELRAPSRAIVSQEVDVVGDRDATLVFSFVEEPRTEAPSAPPPSPAAASPWRTVGWVGAGVGATTLLVTLLVDVAALGPKVSEYRAAADRGDPGARGLREDAVGLRTGTIVGYVTGGIVTGAGLGIVLFGPRSPTVAVAPWASQTAAGISLGSAL
jgi:tetratricopeptide (TPR) repeat protein